MTAIVHPDQGALFAVTWLATRPKTAPARRPRRLPEPGDLDLQPGPVTALTPASTTRKPTPVTSPTANRPVASVPAPASVVDVRDGHVTAQPIEGGAEVDITTTAGCWSVRLANTSAGVSLIVVDHADGSTPVATLLRNAKR